MAVTREQQRMLGGLMAFLFVLWCLTTGFMDIDWMVVSNRYSEWHRSVDYWELCPFVKINWWAAYFLSLVRIVIGVSGLTIVALKVLKIKIN